MPTWTDDCRCLNMVVFVSGGRLVLFDQCLPGGVRLVVEWCFGWWHLCLVVLELFFITLVV